MVKNKTIKNKIKNRELTPYAYDETNISQNMGVNSNQAVNSNQTVYSNDDYNSNDGMLTTVWGPSAWHFLHTMSFNYPTCPSESDKIHYKEFILNLKNVLPCGKCRKNLKKNFKKHPLEMKDMESRETFSRYVYELHETINKMLGKKSNLSYEDVKERYEHFRSRCVKPLRSLKKRTVKKVHFAKKVTIMSEKGCTEPLYGEKSKCILQIVPQKTKCETFQMDEKCIKKRESQVLGK
jgi:hypothetical protein